MKPKLLLHRNENREDHDVDIFNLIQKVQGTVIHLEVDEEQWEVCCLYSTVVYLFIFIFVEFERTNTTSYL